MHHTNNSYLTASGIEDGNERSVLPLHPERFVDATVAADFLSLTTRRILELARKGVLPAYPVGTGQRKVWRFRLSELAAALNPAIQSKTTARPVMRTENESHG